MDFVPDRFMGVDTVGEGTQHLGYGAGTRMCIGAHLANRELYVIFTRLVLAFKIYEATDHRRRPILDSIDCNSVPTSMATQPKPFQIRLVPRDADRLANWIKESEEMTASL
jgi:phenylacetate 2-hydroxylase